MIEYKEMLIVVAVCLLYGFHYFIIRKKRIEVINELNAKKQEMEKTVKIGEHIIEIGNKILEIDDQDVLLNMILERAIEVIDYAESGSIMFLKEDGYCEFVASVGFDLNKLKEVSFHVEETFLYEKTNGKLDRAHVVNNVLDFNETTSESPERNETLMTARVINIQTSISAPIFVDHKVYGFINLDSTRKNAFDEEDLIITDIFVGKAGMVVKNHLLLKKIIQLSRYDTLTGIYNRSYFEEILERSIAKGMRYKESFLVVLFDLNGLKNVNDTYGHLAGDGLIAFFTKQMESCVRKSDVLARYGGDEFVGLFYSADEQELRIRFETMSKWFDENLFHFGSDFIKCSFSFGIAEFGKDSTRYDELIKIADDRMYQHKRGVRFGGK